MKPLSECRLYTFVDTAFLHGRSPGELARQLCAGGSDLIQLRAKDRSPDQIRRMAEELLPITNAAGAGLVINDHPRIAAEVGAPVAHLGQEDFFDRGFTHISSLLTPQTSDLKPQTSNLRPQTFPQIGLSTHAPDQAERAIAAGADYIAIGPVFATGTKPNATPVTLDYVRWAAAHVNVPWFAIGGITLNNLDEVLDAGARRICVVSAILNAPDIAKACQSFRDGILCRLGKRSDGMSE